MVSEGILAHSEGVTLSQELGETIALVKAHGAAGLEIDNMRGAATDWRGYTVKTQLNPYDENRVAISDNYFSKSNIELIIPSLRWFPRVVQWLKRSL